MVWRWGNTDWSFDFVAVAPEGLSIVAGAVTHPSGLTRQMEPKPLLPRAWRASWRFAVPDTGVHVQSVEYDSGESDVLKESKKNGESGLRYADCEGARRYQSLQ
jgi:hypothetical protein